MKLLLETWVLKDFWDQMEVVKHQRLYPLWSHTSPNAINNTCNKQTNHAIDSLILLTKSFLAPILKKKLVFHLLKHDYNNGFLRIQTNNINKVLINSCHNNDAMSKLQYGCPSPKNKNVQKLGCHHITTQLFTTTKVQKTYMKFL